MPDFNWYTVVGHEEGITQGDIVDGCPAATFRADALPGEPAEGNVARTEAQLLDELDNAGEIIQQRVVVMSQACDILHGKLRNVILCPVYDLAEVRAQWSAGMTAKNQNPTPAAWAKRFDAMRAGEIWNLALLGKHEHADPAQSRPVQAVDFHEVFSLPLLFLQAWCHCKGGNRLRLLPPYREHLSQAFARYFMRIGLPEDISAADGG